MEFEVTVPAKAIIGESPTWSRGEGALYWIDVKAPSLSRLQVDTGEQRTWSLSSDIGAFCLTGDGGAVVALRHGLHHLNLQTGEERLLAPPPFDPSLFRFNEGACDPEGRFWVGEMFDPLTPGLEPRPGRLHSFTFADGLRSEPDAGVLHNGMAWSDDGESFFLSHSYERTIYRFDFDSQTGRIGDRRVFARVGSDDGIPDGAAIDVEGGYWTALHGAGRLRRINSDGSVDRDWTLPISQPTMPAFAGRDLDILYLTSAAEKTSPAKEPAAGDVFCARPGVSGVMRRAYIA